MALFVRLATFLSRFAFIVAALNLVSWLVKIVATRCHILRLKCTKFNFGWALHALDPSIWGSRQRSPCSTPSWISGVLLLREGRGTRTRRQKWSSQGLDPDAGRGGGCGGLLGCRRRRRSAGDDCCHWSPVACLTSGPGASTTRRWPHGNHLHELSVCRVD